MRVGFPAAGLGFGRHGTRRMLEVTEHMIAADLVKKACTFQENAGTMMQFRNRKADAAMGQIGGNLA
jgi:hypothetical protein